MIKSISKRQIGIIGGIFGLILLVIILGGGDNKDNQIPEQEGQQTQASLNQSIQNISTPEEGIENENSDDLDLEQSEQPAENIEKQGLLFKVIKVIDGDTIKLENGEAVRYIGIDIPETVHPSEPVQCFGKEASDKNKELVEEKMLNLRKILQIEINTAVSFVMSGLATYSLMMSLLDRAMLMLIPIRPM